MANYDIFAEAERILTEAGALLTGGLDCSGKLVRCPTQDKPRKQNFSYICHLDDPPCNVNFCNWEQSGKWQTVVIGKESMAAKMTDLERQQLQERIRQRQEADKKAYELALQKTMAKALKFYSSLPIAGKDNAYLIKKGIPTTYPNLRQCNNGNLAVPVYDSKNRLCSLQFIMVDGQKRFMAGRLPETYFYPFKAKDGGKDGPLIVVEGFGTAAAIYESTGYAVLASFSAGNLESVARFARSIYPERPIIIACDYDEPNQTYTNAGGTGVKLGTLAAQAINGKLAIPPLPDGFEKVDFNDLYLHKDYGLVGVKGIIDEALAQPAIEKGHDLQDAEEWPEINPYESVDIPKLDINHLPILLRDFCIECAEAYQVPPELPLSNLLGALATASQWRYCVQVKIDYKEPVNIYTCCPLPPANLKTSVVRDCIAPLREWERQQSERLAPVIKEKKSLRQTMERAIAKAREKAASKTNPDDIRQAQNDIAALEKELPEDPIMPRLLIDDATPEAMADLLAKYGERLSIVSSEGGIFDILAGQYNKGVAVLDLFLKAWSGEGYISDRKTSGTISLANPLFTVSLSPQPIVLETLRQAKIFRGRGALGRFLYFMPESLLGRRNVEPMPMTDQTKQAYRQKILSLLPAEWENRPYPVTLRLSYDAYDLWVKFWKKVDNSLAPDGELSNLLDWGGKLHGQVIRLAGLFHIADHDKPENVPISADTMAQAVYMGNFLSEHAKAAFSLLGGDMDENTQKAQEILKWIKYKNINFFQAVELCRAKRARFKNEDSTREPLNELIERGYVRLVKTVPADKKGTGRKPSPMYEVNPNWQN